MVLIAADDAERKAKLYACRGCGQVYSPAIYACRSEVAHETALRAARECYKCRTHNTCQDCGAECPKHWLACDACRRKTKIAKSEEVDIETVEECFGLDSGDFFNSAWDAADAGEEWVHPAVLRHYELSPDRVVEWTLDEHHEDAELGDLIGLDALLTAIEAFNKAQTSGTYDEDRTRIARVTPTEDGSQSPPTSDGEVQRSETTEPNTSGAQP